LRLVDHGQLCLRQRQRHFTAVPDVKDGPKAYRGDYLENIQPVAASTGVLPVCTQDPASQLVHMATHETHSHADLGCLQSDVWTAHRPRRFQHHVEAARVQPSSSRLLVHLRVPEHPLRHIPKPAGDASGQHRHDVILGGSNELGSHP